MRRFLAIVAVLTAILPALAQDKADAEQEKSALLTYVEEQLSTPNRKITFSDISGVLSSDAEIGRISIADREGVWLEINDAKIVWTRTALLTGRLVVDKLSAKTIEVTRQPLPEEGAVPSAESSSFAIPELPVTVSLGELAIDKATFGEGVFGLASQLEIKGNLLIVTGKLETALDITRLDGPGGKLDLAASYAGESSVLDLDLSIQEPEDGVVANLLNLYEKPAVSLGLKGSGPVDDLKLALTLDAADKRILTGQARFSGSQAGRRFNIGVAGPVGELVNPGLRDLFGDRSELVLTGVSRTSGTDIERLALTSGALELEGSARTAADGFPVEVRLDGTIESRNATPVVLPLPGGDTKVGKARLEFRFGGNNISTWSGQAQITDFATAGLTASAFVLNLGGAAVALNDPAAREITFVVDGKATGLGSDDAAIAEAIGDRLGLDISGAWKTSQAVTIDRALLSAKVLDVSFAGEIADLALKGQYGLKVTDASVLSAALKRDLAGAAELKANGTVAPVTGAFDLMLDGELTDLALGSAADGLLVGATVISGRAARGEDGIRADNLVVANPQMSLRANGLFGTETADFTFGAEVADLAKLSDKVSGRLQANGAAKGRGGVIDLDLTAAVSGGTLTGRTLSDAVARFAGQRRKSGLTGTVDGSAYISGERIDLKTNIAINENGQRLDDLELNAGATRLAGDVASNKDGLFDGKLVLRSNDISTAAALLLAEASGKVDAEIALDSNGGTQNAEIKTALDNVQYQTLVVGAGNAQVSLGDLFGVPSADGNVALGNLRAGGMDISTFAAKASKRGATTLFEADVAFVDGAALATKGGLAAEGGGYRLTLDEAGLSKGKALARLEMPASVAVTGGTVVFDDVRFDIDGGRLTATGSAGERFDLAVDLSNVPLDVANAIRPDLGLAGTVSGDARLQGTIDQPDISFRIDGDGISAEQLRSAGLPPFTVKATGDATGEALRIDANLSSGNGIGATAKGTVPLTGGALAVDVALTSFPLAVLDRVAGNQGLGGRLSGDARITGPLTRPNAEFKLRGDGVEANVLSEAGLAPLEIGASGSFAGETVTLAALNATGPAGFALNGSGRVPLGGSGLNVTIDGAAPLALANRQLASRGARADGTVQFALQVTGSASSPSIAGQVSTDGASYADPLANLALNNIAVAADLDGERVVIRQGSARIAAGGGVSLSGSVQISGDSGYPADLKINLDNARYADGTLMVATVSGNLGVTGPLIYDPLIAGSLTVNRAEVTIPETLAGGAEGLDVKHINPPRKVTRTLEFARAEDGTPVPSGRPSVARLDISVSAPSRIFVRGRGLDSELGGSVRLTGPVTDIQPVGGFQLIRGRLSILGKRIVFDEGKVTLVGDLDPQLRFVASSPADGATVFITVAGRASNPSVTFTSQPELPQDEVLARLIFGRSISELSAIQIAKLAASAAQLAGGGNASLLDSFRQTTGLDELDVVTDSGGNAAVRAGRYVQDNIYLGVEAGASGSTKGTINIDITDNLKATGSAGSEGDSSIGIFFEKDY